MSEITLENLQKAIAKINHKNNAIDKYFYKLTEEVGELAKVIRKDKRLESSECIKDTVEEELYDVLYYVICLANMYEILEKNFLEQEPELFEKKELCYKTKRQTPATLRQKKYLMELAEYHKIVLDVSVERLNRSEASRLINQLIWRYGKWRYPSRPTFSPVSTFPLIMRM